MRKTVIIVSMLVLLANFACQKKEPVFTLVESRVIEHFDIIKSETEYYYYYSYGNYVLIENVPDDKMELKRLMIDHFLNLNSSMIDTLRSNSNFTFLHCEFLKSTSATRARFSIPDEEKRGRETYIAAGERNSFGWYNNKTCIGRIFINRCDEDDIKFEVKMYMNSGTDSQEFRDRRGPEEEEFILLNECDTMWYNQNKDNELVKYFMEQKLNE